MTENSTVNEPCQGDTEPSLWCHNQSTIIMTEKELNEWGTSADLDTCEKIYREHGISRSWVDYSIPGATDLDNAWDQDKYYADFNLWWKNLPQQEKYRIYHRITGRI